MVCDHKKMSVPPCDKYYRKLQMYSIKQKQKKIKVIWKLITFHNIKIRIDPSTLNFFKIRNDLHIPGHFEQFKNHRCKITPHHGQNRY